MKLSGDKAYELFMSGLPFPLHQFLNDWKDGKEVGDVGYIIAVMGAYNRMCVNSFDGRYNKHRKAVFTA